MYVYKKKTALSYADAISKVKDALKEQGFGVLTEIDVKNTLKSKIGVDFDHYTILGACNPMLAHQALSAERDIGALLPCNVIVYVQNDETFIAVVLPSVQLGKTGNPALLPIAEQAEQKLKQAVYNVSNMK